MNILAFISVRREHCWTALEMALAVVLGGLLFFAVAGRHIQSNARWRAITAPSADKRPAALYIAYRLYALESSRDGLHAAAPREALEPYFDNPELRKRLVLNGSASDTVDALLSEYDVFPELFTDPAPVAADRIIFAQKPDVDPSGWRFIVLGDGRILKTQSDRPLTGQTASAENMFIVKSPLEQWFE